MEKAKATIKDIEKILEVARNKGKAIIVATDIVTGLGKIDKITKIEGSKSFYINFANSSFVVKITDNQLYLADDVKLKEFVVTDERGLYMRIMK